MKNDFRQNIAAIISAAAAGGVFVLLLFSVLIDIPIAVGTYAGLYLITKPKRRIERIDIDFIENGAELEQKLLEAKEDYESIKRSIVKIVDTQVKDEAERLAETIPKLRAEAQASGNPMDAQLVRDFEDEIDRFEKKIYDLELSRTIAVQTAPQIKMIQNNDRVLVDKIQTAVLNTIPIWKSQFVIAMGLNDQQRVLKMQREITDTTNKMLLKNSELLKTNTVETARESNRGIVDIETLQKVNQNLISTIEETIQIQKDSSRQRAEAEKALGKIEDDLKNKLVEIMNNK